MVNKARKKMEKNKLLVHKHLIIRAEAISPPMDEEFLRRWLEKFISEIDD